MCIVTHELSEKLVNTVISLANEQGVLDPALAETTDDRIVIVDQETGDTYKLKLHKF